MADRPSYPGYVSPSEAAALWRARDEDRAEAKDRFGRLEQGVDALRLDVHEVKQSVASIETAEHIRAASVEKRNQRIWQVASGVMVGVFVALVITLFKIFAPIAVTGAQVKPPTVNEQLDRMHGTLQE